MIRVRTLLVLVLLLASAVPSLMAQATPPQAAPPPATPAPAQGKSLILEKVIVKVNGEIFTQSELERVQIDALREQNAKVSSAAELSTDAGLMKALSEITPSILLETIDELLLLQYGREQGVKFTDDNFKMALENVKKQNKIDDKQFVIALKDAGLTLDQLRQNFERTFIKEQVERREVMKNMSLTEEEARQYYKAHPTEFMKAPTVTLREIAITVPTETIGGQQTVNVARDEAAREKMTAVRERAVKGEDFAALVAEASEAGTKANGGIVGPLVVEELSPAVATAIGKLKPGEVTEVLKLGNGYRVFKLESRTAAEAEPFDKVREQIANRIYDTRLPVEREKFLSNLRGNALIEWKDDTYKKMFEQASAKRGKSGL